MRTVRFELLRPNEIVAERERCPVIYFPVGPLEWHSSHMPFGTDALNAEAVARRVAERTGGVVLPTFFWGTERERPPEMAADLGFDERDYIVGMDFPANTIPSLYCREEYFALLVREMLDRLLRLDYKLIVIVNGHGAANHIQTLQRLSIEFSAETPATVLYTFAIPKHGPGFVGHAAAFETSIMMALYPECVTLDQLPPEPEPIRYVETAIVNGAAFNGQPTPDRTLPREADPRHSASAEWGNQIIEQTVREIADAVNAALQEI